MRSYIKAFLSPDGRTIANSDLWGNYNVIAVMRQPHDNQFGAINFLNSGAGGLVRRWRGLDASLTVIEEYPGELFGFQYGCFGYRPYADHPLN